MPCELCDAGAGAVAVGEVGGQGGGSQELVVLGGGGERGAVHPEGLAGCQDGAVLVEGVGDLLYGESGGGIGSAAWGNADASEPLLEAADAHTGGLSQLGVGLAP